MMEDKLEGGSPSFASAKGLPSFAATQEGGIAVGEGGASPVAPSSPVVEEVVIDDAPHGLVEAPQAGERTPLEPPATRSLPDDVRMKLSTLLEALWRESADLERKACLRVVEEMASTIRGPARNLLDIAAKGIRKRGI